MMADMAAFNEEQRKLLQRILDDPKTECEKAFREVELMGKSQPKEWEPTLCGMHVLCGMYSSADGRRRDLSRIAFAMVVAYVAAILRE